MLLIHIIVTVQRCVNLPQEVETGCSTISHQQRASHSSFYFAAKVKCLFLFEEKPHSLSSTLTDTDDSTCGQMMDRGYHKHKPLSGELDDCVELPLQGCGAFAHLDVLAVFCYRGVDLSLSPGLGFLQTQELRGGRRHQQRLWPRQRVVTWRREQ